MLKVASIFEPILTGDDRPKLLHDYPVAHVQPIAWGDMDGFNHVNNVAYYRYAESVAPVLSKNMQCTVKPNKHWLQAVKRSLSVRI